MIVPIKFHKQHFFFLTLLLVSLFTFFYSLSAPLYDWDAIAYIASAKKMLGSSLIDAHAYTYQSLRETLPEYHFNELAYGHRLDTNKFIEYRVAMVNDPSAFEETLKFYNIRVLYIFSISTIINFGVNPLFATTLISALFSAGTVILIWLSLKNVVHTLYLPAIIFSIGWSGVISIGQISTPDAMATFFVMLLFTLHCYSNRMTFFICPVLVAIRTDLFFLSILYLLHVFVKYPSQRKLALISILTSVIVLYMLNSYYDYPGWNAILHFTFTKNYIHPLTEIPPFSITNYLYRLVRATASIIITPPV